MKQILQRLDNGETTLLDVPVPHATGIKVVIRTRASLISAGTERMLVQFGKGSLLDKARSQPERVLDVLAKVRTDGLLTTVEAVRGKLAAPVPLGYCNAGIVADVGPGVTRFAVGDRVVSNGPHAEYVTVPHTLVAKIPAGVGFESAAFAPLAAIGLQGIRLANPTFGETVVVYGLGLIGLLCVQLLRANGCQVVGIDRSSERLALGEGFGARVVDGASGDAVRQVLALTDGIGADAVLLTLTSESDEPMREAASMSRKRGRLVLVGVTGLNLSRDELFKKELSFQVSCSYGPGRYDPQYEDRGVDYPVGYVRWTEQRNFEAVLAAMAAGQLDPLPLITHRFPLSAASEVYQLVAGPSSSIGIILQYPEDGAASGAAKPDRIERRAASATASGQVSVGVIGAGNFATRMLLPLLKARGVRLRAIMSGSGTSAAVAGKQFDFERVSTSVDDVMSDSDVNTVFVLTRHDSHAALVRRALEAGKHVFVEKPLALTDEGLDAIEHAASESGTLLMVGFNRRFAPLTRELRDHLSARTTAMALSLVVNAGAIPREHWVQDAVAGGGRIVGEGCHFVDLARFLVGAPIERLQVTSAADRRGDRIDDVASIMLTFADGSIASIQYLSNGGKTFPKERIEAFFDGKTLQIDNWRRMRRFGIGGPLFSFGSRQDKGHAAQIAAWVEAVEHGGPAPIPLSELIEVSRYSIRAGEMARRPEA
jgi:predicted dehydrogenase/threonine dehydrogenase-like Zn-dependent dehydrogenase